MVWLFTLIPHLDILIAVICLIGVGLAFVYVPDPFKHYVMDALLMLSMAVSIYGWGFDAAATSWKAKYDTAIAEINAANEKAQAEAVAREVAREQANTASVKAALDAEAAQHDADNKNFQKATDEITKAGADADAPAPGLILDAINGAAK